MTNKEVIEKLFAMKKCGGLTNEYRQAINLAVKALEDRPTGEWVITMNDFYVCSICGAYGNPNYFNFCPNCGARMKGW